MDLAKNEFEKIVACKGGNPNSEFWGGEKKGGKPFFLKILGGGTYPLTHYVVMMTLRCIIKGWGCKKGGGKSEVNFEFHW